MGLSPGINRYQGNKWLDSQHFWNSISNSYVQLLFLSIEHHCTPSHNRSTGPVPAVEHTVRGQQSLELTGKPYLLKTLFHFLEVHHQLQLLDALVWQHHQSVNALINLIIKHAGSIECISARGHSSGQGFCIRPFPQHFMQTQPGQQQHSSHPPRGTHTGHLHMENRREYCCSLHITVIHHSDPNVDNLAGRTGASLPSQAPCKIYHISHTFSFS